MIDAHFHIWQLARADYGWLTAAQGSLYRDVCLDDWRRARESCGITGGILVQAAPTEAETRFLLGQASTAPDVLGVVGWVDLLAEDAARRIQTIARQPKLCGLRPMLQDLADPDWILQDALAPALKAMVAADLAFDALVKPLHIPRIVALASQHPGLRIVVDHGAKPDIAGGLWDDWASGVADLARMPQVYCKLSGLWNEAARGTDATALAAHTRHLLACFGADRLLWGSDWPVLDLAGSYAAWHMAARQQLAHADHLQVFELAARRAYRLKATG